MRIPHLAAMDDKDFIYPSYVFQFRIRFSLILYKWYGKAFTYKRLWEIGNYALHNLSRES